MIRFDPAISAFDAAAARADDMVRLFDALVLMNANPLIRDDALRSAWIQIVSSYDFFVHEIVAVEVAHRLISALPLKGISIPIDHAVIADTQERFDAFEAHFRLQNSYKAFVAPDKLKDVLACFTTHPWQKIEQEYRNRYDPAATEADLKLTIKAIWDRRNKVTHEADINPTLAGAQLWPISKQDTEATIDAVKRLAACLPGVAAQH